MPFSPVSVPNVKKNPSYSMIKEVAGAVQNWSPSTAQSVAMRTVLALTAAAASNAWSASLHYPETMQQE